ncbi:response regulator transcription factor [Paraclostridium sordellii]|uniref:response regulator transcription factor n=1 Tax=Paraclostridium sordellii TaxID=1505 RepID=UPI0005E8D46D|nr:response regulator transcription factor [Paeniclostridium sordellii]CEP82387.1 two component transcriptional regulator [[Clostridium] sordellii] [Paeniclostridium sordellii]
MEVLVISKSFIVREAIGLFFSSRFEDYKVKSLKDLSEAHNISLSNVEFVFIDIDQGSTDSIGYIKEIFQNIKIMIFNKDRNREIFIECFRNGINSYLIDIPEKDELMHIVSTVIKGKKYYDLELLEDVLDIKKESSFESIDLLTDRENEVLDKVSIGLTNKEIANQLYVSEHTIKKHITNILAKLDMRNRRDLIIYTKYKINSKSLSIR